ncbi:sugar transferase [Dactylosporangium sp. NPDC051541]|uniref:sugar transferase n=1 Tax=Dactylosporangium sp. NPDC051541 TaxID=3363977 RepID=UPI00379448F0
MIANDLPPYGKHARLDETTELPVVGSGPPAESTGVPRQRSGGAEPADQRSRPAGRPKPSISTTVLPYAISTRSSRTRSLRAWMLTAPVDLLALCSPLLFTYAYWKGTIFTAALTVIIFAVGGHYRPRRHVSILDELPGLCVRMLASAAVVAIIAALRHDSLDYVASLLRSVAVAGPLVILGRTLTLALTVLARRNRWVEHNALIIGSGPTALELARLVRRYPQYGLRFAGSVDIPEATGPMVPIGTLDEIEQIIPVVNCDVIIVADTECPEPELMDTLHLPLCSSRDLWVVPRMWGTRTQGISDHIGAIPVVRIRSTSLTGLQRWAKRAFDLIVSGIILIVLSPLLLLTAIAVRLEGGRGIIFRQERIGLNGVPFELLKFRSMRPVNEQESQTNWSIANDKRVGPVGRFIRKTSIDELPQLWNIVRGDMTVVGPRPERPFFVEQFSAEHPEYSMRHRVPVGLTGLAQVSGLRGDTPISDRARFDNYYAENWSLWLDIKVVLRTVSEVFRGGGSK